MKREKKANSYDEVIEELIKHELNLPDTLLGFMQGKTQPYQRDPDEEDHEP